LDKTKKRAKARRPGASAGNGRDERTTKAATAREMPSTVPSAADVWSAVGTDARKEDAELAPAFPAGTSRSNEKRVAAGEPKTQSKSDETGGKKEDATTSALPPDAKHADRQAAPAETATTERPESGAGTESALVAPPPSASPGSGKHEPTNQATVGDARRDTSASEATGSVKRIATSDAAPKLARRSAFVIRKDTENI
jgi:hypothetical protein